MELAAWMQTFQGVLNLTLVPAVIILLVLLWQLRADIAKRLQDTQDRITTLVEQLPNIYITKEVWSLTVGALSKRIEKLEISVDKLSREVAELKGVINGSNRK